MAKKYNYQDNFEMLMLRHDYMKRVKDPDPRWIKEFEPIVAKTSWIMFDKHRPNFTKMGYEIEDIMSVANCYMIAYMSLYSIRNNKEILYRVRRGYKKRFGQYPDQEYIDKKEKINMISFLRQRLQHAAVICGRKIRNITVDNEKVAAYAYTKDTVKVSDYLIYNEGDKYGYRKLTKAELKDIEKEAKENKTSELYDKDGFPVVKVFIPNEGISVDDYEDLFIHSKDDLYHNDPEESITKMVDTFNLEGYRQEYNGMKPEDQKELLNMFIDRYKGNKRYRVELKEARRKLKNM